jgi:hypothetical protein
MINLRVADEDVSLPYVIATGGHEFTPVDETSASKAGIDPPEISDGRMSKIQEPTEFAARSVRSS